MAPDLIKESIRKHLVGRKQINWKTHSTNGAQEAPKSGQIPIVSALCSQPGSRCRMARMQLRQAHWHCVSSACSGGVGSVKKMHQWRRGYSRMTFHRHVALPFLPRLH
jgi:hypothetical protein